MTYDKAYTLKTHAEVFDRAKTVFRENDLNIAQALNRFLKQVALTGELDLLSEDELLFRQLQSEVKKSIDDVEQGKGVTLTEARKRFGL